MVEHTNKWMNFEAGVFQGSVLCPVLFLLIIADLNNYLPAGADTEKYADDIISYIIGTNTTTELPQQITYAVQLWCFDNRMRLNSEKCKVMHFKVKKANPP